MTTFKEIREQFVKLSGRYELVVDAVDYADNGANFYIHAGQRMLDKLAGFPKDLGRHFETVPVGTYYITFTGCRSIHEVWAANSTDRWQLTALTNQEFDTNYAKPFGSVTTGKVSYFTKAKLRGIPDFTAVDAISGYAEEIASDNSQIATTGIMFMPPVDEETQIEVIGLFDTYKLSSEADKNYWTETNPEALVFAALYKLEVSYRNSEGANDWLREIMRIVADIDKDEVAEDTYQAEEMAG